MRVFFGILCGVLAGALLSSSMSAGLYYRFPDEFSTNAWGVFIWGEHWFIRAIVSVICAFWAGFISGLISRKNGCYTGIVAVAPSWMLWVGMAYIALTGNIPFFQRGVNEVYLSLGNKLSIGFILLALFPAAWLGGKHGELYGQNYSEHFDSRPRSLLGIKWYHYLWIPIILFLVLKQGAYVGLYFLVWLKALWKTGMSFKIFSYIIPAIFTIALYGTLYLMGQGIINSYRILAGFEVVDSSRKAFMLILKYAIGYQVLAAILQAIIQAIHFFLGKWFG